MSGTGWASGAVAAALVVLVAGCTGGGSGPDGGPDASPSEALAPFYEQEINWKDCGGAEGDAGFECGTYEVPLDYADPDGERVRIAVKRLPARGGDAAGSLVVNPGGPGGSGYDYAGAAASVISERVRQRYDVVGFDPRGVGRSEPVTCLKRQELDAYLGAGFRSEDGDGDPTEVTEAGLAELEESNRAFVEACRENSGELVTHMGTAEVARDMDVLRAVLGDEKLTYLGKSYGTYIGAHYADRFPERVRALVLDGAMDPGMDQLEMSVQQAEGFRTALRAFVADCVDSTGSCPLGDDGTSVDEGVDRIAGLLADAGRDPLASDLGDGREVTRARLEMGLMAALYSKDYWPRVRSALGDAFDGDGTAMLRLADELYDRTPGGGYENTTAALIAVNCSDHPSPRRIGAYEKAADAAAEKAPLFGPPLAWGALPCAYWPKEAVAEPEPLDAPGAAPILVVGTTRDSATPYAWAKRLAGELESGVLLTREGDGHTGYRMGNSCVDRAVDTYLLEADPPKDGTVCAE